MTDRELLELVAKAVKIDVSAIKIIEGRGIYFGFAYFWDPLNNDGDAFYVASYLKMNISFSAGYQDASVYGSKFTAIEPNNIKDWEVNPAYFTEEQRRACMRRAICRAAAEIGKTL